MTLTLPLTTDALLREVRSLLTEGFTRECNRCSAQGTLKRTSSTDTSAVDEPLLRSHPHGILLHTATPEIVKTLVDSCMNGHDMFFWATRVAHSRMPIDAVVAHFNNAVYASVIGPCEAQEHMYRMAHDKDAPGYTGNGHHWAQRLVASALASPQGTEFLKVIAKACAQKEGQQV